MLQSAPPDAPTWFSAAPFEVFGATCHATDNSAFEPFILSLSFPTTFPPHTFDLHWWILANSQRNSQIYFSAIWNGQLVGPMNLMEADWAVSPWHATGMSQNWHRAHHEWSVALPVFSALSSISKQQCLKKYNAVVERSKSTLRPATCDLHSFTLFATRWPLRKIKKVIAVKGVEGAHGFRQPQPATSQPSTAAMSANSHSENPYGFGPYLARQNHAFTQLHGRRDPFQYQSEHTHDPRRQQDPQQYTSQLLNGVYQRQNSRQSPYEPAEQYQPRPVYFNQFGVVENYNPSLDGTTSTPGVGPSQHPTARYHPPMHSRPTYLDPSKPASLYNRIEPEFVQCPTTKSAGPYGNQHDGYYIIYSRYRRGLRETNENTSRGRLAEAGESLLEISEWLLSNAEGLGMIADVHT